MQFHCSSSAFQRRASNFVATASTSSFVGSSAASGNGSPMLELFARPAGLLFHARFDLGKLIGAARRMLHSARDLGFFVRRGTDPRLIGTFRAVCFHSAWANPRKREKRRERRQFFGPPATHHIVALVAAKNWMAPIATPSSGIIFTSFIRVFFCFPTQKQMKTPAFPEPNERTAKL